MDQIEVTKVVLDAFSRRDLPTILDHVEDDFELNPLISVWQRNYRGREGVEQWWHDVAEVWDEFAIEGTEFRRIDDQTLLVVVSWSGRATGGSVDLAGPGAALVRFRGERPVSASVYVDEASAVRAAAGD